MEKESPIKATAWKAGAILWWAAAGCAVLSSAIAAGPAGLLVGGAVVAVTAVLFGLFAEHKP